MDQPDSGSREGEARSKARLKRRYLIIGALLSAGFLVGVYVGQLEGGSSAEASEKWPALSLLLIALYFGALFLGAALLHKITDEHEAHNNYKAASLAGYIYIAFYPSWYLLWKGNYVQEPVHWIVFCVFWLSLVLANLYYRFR